MTGATTVNLHARLSPSRPRIGSDAFYGVMLALPALFMATLYLLPVANVLAMSVTVPSFGLQNYVELLANGPVARVVATTLRIGLITTTLALVIGYATAYALVHMGERERRLLLLLVVTSFWVSALIRAFAWVAILQPRGLLNTILMGLGLIEAPLVLVRNEIGVAIGMVHYMLPYAILPLYANLSGIDKRLVPAARTLGASPWFAFSRVFLPLSIPGIVGAAILVFIFSLGFYITPAILGGGKTMMLAEYISVQISETLRWGLAATLSTALLGGVLILTLVLMRFMDMGQTVKR